MKETLRIEHLAPYLPYGLKWIDKIGNKHNTSWISSKNVCLIDTNGYGGEQAKFLIKHVHKYVKPILRPLSDLTKEIEHEGKKFVPALILFPVDVDEEKDFDVYGKIPDYWKHSINQVKDGRCDYNDMKMLHKWHFDVFGLIDAGLAIDVNALNK